MFGSEKQTMQVAEFTKDMLTTMVEYFEFFADSEDVLTVEVNHLGIWVEEPSTKTKKYFGKARYSQRDKENIKQAKALGANHCK